MAIFQPFLESTVQGQSVPRPSNSFAGVGAISGAVESLAKLGTTFIETQAESKKGEGHQAYLNAIEEAGQLKDRGLFEESRARLNAGSLAFARLGGNSSAPVYAGLRKDRGLGDVFLEDPEDTIRRTIMDTDVFKAELFRITSGVDPDTVDLTESQQIELALLTSQRRLANMAILTNENTEKSVRFASALTNADASIADFNSTIFSMARSNQLTGDEDFLELERIITESSATLTALAVTPQDTAAIKLRVDHMRDTVAWLKENRGVEGLAAQLHTQATQFLMRNTGPGQRFSLHEFTVWLQRSNPNSAMSRNIMAGLAAAPEDQIAFEKLDNAVRELNFAINTTADIGRLSLSRPDLTDTEVAPDNKLAQKVSRVRTLRRTEGADPTGRGGELVPIKSWAEAAEVLLPDVAGAITDRNDAMTFAVALGWTGGVLDRLAEEGGYMSEKDMRKFFNKTTMSNLETLKNDYPDIFIELFDILNASKGSYTTKVQERTRGLRSQLGIEVDEEGVFRANIDVIEANDVLGIGPEKSALARKSFDKLLLEVYGGDNPAVALLEGYGDNLEKMRRRLLGPRGRSSEEMILADSMVTKLRNSIEQLQPNKHQDMWKGHALLTEFIGGVTETFFRIGPVDSASFDKYSGLVPFLDKTEGLGNYDTLFGRAETGSLSGAQKVSTMTLDQAIRFSAPGGAYRVAAGGDGEMGRYQIIHDTLKRMKTSMNLSGLAPFNRNMQDRIFVELAENATSGIKDPTKLIKALRSVWFGLRNIPDAELLVWANNFLGIKTE